MKIKPLQLYSLAAVAQVAGSSGAAMLAPFFMKAHGYSIAAASVPLVVNGIGRVCSDLTSGVLASYFSSGVLIVAASAASIAIAVLAHFFIQSPLVFLGAFTLLGITEATFALSIRKIAFEQSEPGQQGRVQGQVAAALGIGFSLGPLASGFAGKIFGPQVLFAFYALPQVLGLILILLGGAHRSRAISQENSVQLWHEGKTLLTRASFLASALAVFQSFVMLVGVTRIAFPFLAVNQRGFGLDWVGSVISISRITDTFGRYTGGWLCDRITAPRVILLGVAIGIPMFIMQPYGSGVVSLVLPLTIMTMGFGYTNVGATTFALQSAGPNAKALALGLTRSCTSLGNTLGPLMAGLLVQHFGYETGYHSMAAISAAILVIAWLGLRKQERV
jgi:MFS transporter, DHA1 family, multidrug resistance protein